MKKNYFELVNEASKYIETRISKKPEYILILSGGLGEILDHLKNPIKISASEIPHFPKASVQGHSGELIFGDINGKQTVVFKGRFHYYEGHDMKDIIFPIFTMHSLGAKNLIATNATGGINKTYKTGDIMVINDHINFMGANPLRGIATLRHENQFTDMTEAYNKTLKTLALTSAKELELELKEGTYIAFSGPNYETKKEIQMARAFGADTVGMSVVPEVTAANFLNMKVLAFACIANMAADIHEGKISHSEVLNSMKRTESRLVKLLLKIFEKI